MRKIIFDKGDYLKQKRKEELKKKGEEIRKKCKRRKYTNILYFETKEDVFKHITSYYEVDYEIPQEVIKHIINEAMYCGIHVSKGEIWKCVERIQYKPFGTQTGRISRLDELVSREREKLLKHGYNYGHNYYVNIQGKEEELAEKIINNMYDHEEGD